VLPGAVAVVEVEGETSFLLDSFSDGTGEEETLAVVEVEEEALAEVEGEVEIAVVLGNLAEGEDEAAVVVVEAVPEAVLK